MLDYSGGLRYLEMVRDPTKPDLLAEILKPAADRSPSPQPQPTEAEGKRRRRSCPPKGLCLLSNADSRFKIDGRLDDEAWGTAPWTDAFVDIQGDADPAPRFADPCPHALGRRIISTSAPCSKSRMSGARLTQHDSIIFHDNDFEIFIDPDGDNHEYYEIEINALNTEWDLFLKKPYRDGGPAVNEWEIPGLKTAVQISGTLNDPRDTDTSWSVELAIPWKSLAEHAHRPAPPQRRRPVANQLLAGRVAARNLGGKYRKIPNTPEDNWVWSPQGKVDMHRPERWGYVQFSTAERARRPSGSTRQRRFATA